MNLRIVKKGIYILGFILIFLVGVLAVNTFNIGEKISGILSVGNSSTFYENFSSGVLDSQLRAYLKSQLKY